MAYEGTEVPVSRSQEAIRNVWSAAPSQAESERDRLVCANVYGLLLELITPGQDGMRCALFPFS
jgi:hypothetical protein